VTEKVNTFPANPTSAKPASEDTRGDILLCGFWAHGTDCIIDVQVTDTDAKSYCHHDPAKVIAMQKKGEEVKVP
jgi:hypothetical protein